MDIILAFIMLLVIVVIAWAVVRFVLRLTGCLVQAAIMAAVAIVGLFIIRLIL